MTTSMPLPACRQIIADGIPARDACHDIAHLMVSRRVNACHGTRPSDAARAEVHAHALYGCEEYRQQYERGK